LHLFEAVHFIQIEVLWAVTLCSYAVGY